MIRRASSSPGWAGAQRRWQPELSCLGGRAQEAGQGQHMSMAAHPHNDTQEQQHHLKTQRGPSACVAGNAGPQAMAKLVLTCPLLLWSRALLKSSPERTSGPQLPPPDMRPSPASLSFIWVNQGWGRGWAAVPSDIPLDKWKLKSPHGPERARALKTSGVHMHSFL